MKKFFVCGKTIRVYRYLVTWEEVIPYGDKDAILREQYCESKKDADYYADKYNDSEITELDTSAYEWLDGIEVPDMPDTYAEAVKIYEMGQEAWETQQNTPTAEQDSAAMLVDHEYRLTLLELGVK